MSTWRTFPSEAVSRDPRPVADSLDRVTRGLGTPGARLLTSVFADWPRLVGQEVAAHARPCSLRDGVLVIAADQPAWAAQLRYLAPDMLARIRAGIATTEIAQIQIRVGAPAPAGARPYPPSGRRQSPQSRGRFRPAG